MKITCDVWKIDDRPDMSFTHKINLVSVSKIWFENGEIKFEGYSWNKNGHTNFVVCEIKSQNNEKNINSVIKLFKKGIKEYNKIVEIGKKRRINGGVGLSHGTYDKKIKGDENE